MIRLVFAAIAAAGYAGICAGQNRETAVPNADGPLPSFEAAAVKTTAPGNMGDAQWSKPGGSMFNATNMSLNLLIALAYGVDATQIKGAPAWFGSRHFDIRARAENGISLSREALRPRLQRLLQERFHMQLHHDTSLAQGFGLVVSPHGARLIAAKGDLPQTSVWTWDPVNYTAPTGQWSFAP